ncbi:Na/Pi cotransporter [Roseivirga seohaensis]|uniref:Na/Pi cotransporter n=2 Tax=Roseivirga seohaensis TaxID=1914963 RepID=A0A0L8AJN4_9BACT|nr:Na/Pi cotransporter family protein [Roseivirga seohaensis]KOF02574.1 Na/Pi cotransporter [Roseivirga seohaensis subsp. aquiponti]KYG84666.1 Na/Pi cotransporter [Roseivirga seohaensis]|tara:strand:+ start:4401 stop:6089 length:1689 start_codon:yes stop_codon:yes gene_type:complete
MDYGIWNVIELLGALGFFIYGMKVMSEGIQKAAGDNLRSILGTMTSNRYTGVLTGFLITAIVQSSSATTVMTVSFVNAGLISLVESAGVMMGANIGTTITGWLVSLIGFKMKISAYALPLIAVAMPLMFSKKPNLKNWSEFMIGFALLFLGLEALKEAVPEIQKSPELLSFLTQFNDPGILTRLLFVGVGTILTIVVQSSSAAMAVTIVLCAQGLPIEIGTAMILGENIGTTITAELAALVGNVHAKRSAKIHSLFNIIGVTWMVIMLPYVLDLLHYIWPAPETGDPNKFTLALFHTTFNFMNVMLLIWFVPSIVKLATRLVKSKGDEDEEFSLTNINYDAPLTAEVSILSAQKESIKFAEITKLMFTNLKELLNEQKQDTRDKLKAKISKLEVRTDEIEERIADYLVRVSEQQLSIESSVKVRSILSIAHDLERIADIILRMSKDIERGNKQKSVFSEKQNKNIKEIFGLVDLSIEQMITNLNGVYGKVDISGAIETEMAINALKTKMRKQHLKSTEKKEYDVQSGIIYRDLFFAAEKIGDHVINVSEAVRGDFGKDDEDM